MRPDYISENPRKPPIPGGVDHTHSHSAPLVHIGLPKAGSTWLQRRVFSNADLGFSMPWGAQSPQFIEHVKVIDTFIFDEKVNELRKQYDAGLKQSQCQGLFPVISFETIMFDPCGGKADRRDGARRLRALFPDGKFLLMIREQRSIILSSYNEYLRRGFPCKIDRFLGFDKLRRPGFGATCAPEAFLYDRWISYLKEVFGEENLLVLPIELARSDEFERRLYGFIGHPVRPEFRQIAGIKEREKRKSDFVILRYLNHFGRSRFATKTTDSLLRQAAYGVNILADPLVPDFLYKRAKERLETYIDEKLSGYYTESNKQTSKMIGLDLEALGYS